jgi:hypothetical protein
MKFTQPPGIRTVLLAVVLYSCGKSNDVTPPPAAVNILTDKLEACMKFDNTLTDSVNKATTGVATGTVSFVNDRKGNPASALFLDGTAKVNFTNVNFKGKEITMAAWIKYGATGLGLSLIANATSNNGGIALFQSDDVYGSAVSTPNTNSTKGTAADVGWHHVTSTYDGINIRLYVDGQLINAVNHPGSAGDGMKEVVLGFFSSTFWKGSIDELRIYSKVMNAAGIQQLAGL